MYHIDLPLELQCPSLRNQNEKNTLLKRKKEKKKPRKERKKQQKIQKKKKRQKSITSNYC
jgi:hypothetical protein